MTARDHAAPIPALVHIPLLGRRTVQDKGLALSFQMESTPYIGGEGYVGYVTVAVSKKDFWAWKLKTVFVMVPTVYSTIFNNVF
jgi:hypothetical protein